MGRFEEYSTHTHSQRILRQEKRSLTLTTMAFIIVIITPTLTVQQNHKNGVY